VRLNLEKNKWPSLYCSGVYKGTINLVTYSAERIKSDTSKLVEYTETVEEYS
jgi:hypothetical protein